MPLYLKDSPDFELVRNYLRAVGFNQQSICGLLGIAELAELLSSHRDRTAPPKQLNATSLLVHLLLVGDSFDGKEVETILTSRVLQGMMNLGLAGPDPADESRIFCPVVLYPAGGVLTVSDRWNTVKGMPAEAPADFVYPAMTPNTTEFLAGLPTTPCEDFLELCSGAGTIALIASRYARHAWAADITERSTQFAEFNRLLNGFDNVTAVKADCYEGLEELQFDRIVAHPPYMPVVQPAQIFYDGGQDGEQVTRRIVQGLPRHLKPGGCFYCLAQGSDRKGAPLEQRLRGWLGESHAEFDIAVVERRAHKPEDAALIYSMKSKGGYQALRAMRESLASLAIESLAYGWMIIQRKQDGRKVFTVRRSSDARIRGEELGWLLRWETFAAGPTALHDLLEMTPLGRSSAELRTVHRLKDGELVPVHLAFHTQDPFAMNTQVQPWMAYLLPLCNGQSTVRQLWETCKTHKFIHPETPAEEFARLIGVWISGGFLEVAAYPPPALLASQQPVGSAQEHLQSQAL